MDFTQGFHKDIPFADYCELPGINQSRLKPFLSMSPVEAKYEMEQPSVQSEAQTLGVVTHTLSLEPHTFDSEFFVMPPKTLKWNTKEGKVEKAEFEKIKLANTGKFHILESDYNVAKAMAASVRAHDPAGTWVSTLDTEVSGMWTDPITLEKCKMRVDLLCHNSDNMYDLKTTQSVSLTDIKRSISMWRYDIQVGYYAIGYKAIVGHELAGFSFIFVKKTPPYPVRVVSFDTDAVMKFVDKARMMLDIYATCRESGEWEGYPGVTELSATDLLH